MARRLGERLDETARLAARRLPLRFPRSYAALIDPEDPSDPLRRIAWPAAEELETGLGEILDPVGEGSLELHPLVIQKYPDRAVLLVTRRCHFYCRFCFRAGSGAEPRVGELREAVGVLSRLPGLTEVILSGGDPLAVGDRALAELLEDLGRIPGLETVRLHTRAPIHDPARVTRELAALLAEASPRPLWVVVHATHPRELRPETGAALERLQGAGLPLLSQSVLLSGVNDRAQTLAALFGGLYRRRIRPYYLHHPDRAQGTARFWVSIERGRRIYRELRGFLPGPAVPAYVIDLPDGSGKVPVDWLEPDGAGRWKVERPGREGSVYAEPV